MEIVKKRLEDTGVACSAIDVLDEENNTNAMLRALAPLYEKYEAHAWWYGVFELEVRLLETSFLVFIKRRIMQTLCASFAAFISLVVLREFQPWIKDSDDVVAHAAQCR
mgnify:CR=1 FL=1